MRKERGRNMRLTISEVKVVTRDDLYKAIDYFSLESGEADRRIREAIGISQEEQARKLLEMEKATKIAIAAMYQIMNIMDAEMDEDEEKSVNVDAFEE